MRTSLRTMLVVAAVAVGARAQVPSFGWCPDYLTKQDFSMKDYLGKWYEAERYVNVFEAGSRCVSTDYALAKDGRYIVTNNIQNRLTGLTRLLSGEIRVAPVKGTEAKLNVKYSTLPYPVETSYTVLDTDYDSYSVVWSCSGLGLFNTQNAWVMTRERNPSVSVLQKAYAVLEKHKIGRTFMVKTDQTDCKIAETVDENDVQQEEETPEEGAGGEKSAGPAAAEEPAKPEGEAPAKPAEEPESDGVRKEETPQETPKKPVHEETPKKPVHEEPTNTKKTADEPAKSQ